MFCSLCGFTTPLPSPTECIASEPTSSIEFSRMSSVSTISPSSTRNVSPARIHSSPSQRFPHLPPNVMKILSPETTMPATVPECKECAERYRKKQDEIIDKLMGFVEKK